jgi:hypothetical protein
MALGRASSSICGVDSCVPSFTERVSLQLDASELVAGCFRSVLHTILRLPAVQ